MKIYGFLKKNLHVSKIRVFCINAAFAFCWGNCLFASRRVERKNAPKNKPKSVQKTTKIDPEINQNRSQNQSKSTPNRPQEPPGTPQGPQAPPKSAKDHPGRPPGGPQGGPGALLDPPGGAQGTPKGPPEEPKGAQGAPRGAPRRPKSSQNRSQERKSANVVPKAPPNPFSERFSTEVRRFFGLSKNRKTSFDTAHGDKNRGAALRAASRAGRATQPRTALKIAPKITKILPKASQIASSGPSSDLLERLWSPEAARAAPSSDSGATRAASVAPLGRPESLRGLHRPPNRARWFALPRSTQR